MKSPERLFDCIGIQAARPQADLLVGKEKGTWRKYATTETHELIARLAAGLLDKGVGPGDGSIAAGDKIALISYGRPEWLITDLAVQQTGAILVPVYPNTSIKELEDIFNEAKVKYLFVGSETLYHSLKDLPRQVPSLREIFSYDQIPGATHWSALLAPETTTYHEKVAKHAANVKGEDIATIIYTSGTTGKPKGVMLSHRNILSNVLSATNVLAEISTTERRALSFLPLNHVFEKMVTYIYLFNHFSIYYAESIEAIAQNLREVKPYVFTSVPRLLEKVFERIMETGRQLKGLKRRIFFWSVSLAEKYEINKPRSWSYNLQMALADKLVFSKWRAAIGGNVQGIVVGGAACQVKLARIFSAAKITIMEGYGLTETSPVIAVNGYLEKNRCFGTVGPLLPGVNVRIAADGEICCKGDTIMVGYYQQPELTAEVIKDGWFHTGDIGAFVDDRFLKITDRKKEVFKTSGGKYVAPSPIENKLKENNLIEQVIIVGPERKFTAALIVPAFPQLETWCRQHNIRVTDKQEMITQPEVIRLYQDIIDGFNPEFSHIEQVKKFALVPATWTTESGELTPTGKIKRRIIMERYKEMIDQLYAG